MFHLFSLIVRTLREPFRLIPGEPSANLALSLHEHADSRAGSDPRQAQELRQAASAWLRVVR